MKSSKFLFYFKNGSDAEIRSPKESDVESVISYLLKLPVRQSLFIDTLRKLDLTSNTY